MSNIGPEGAHCFLDGQFYKIGRFNRVFVYRNSEWVFTDGVTIEKLIREIHKQALEEDLELTFKRHTL